MKALTVDVTQATGRILCCTIFRPTGKKLLAKGHLLNQEDVRLLETEGLKEVWVTQLEDGEINEDSAVEDVASRLGCGSLEIRMAAGGRANLFATEDCCLLVDDDLLKEINCIAGTVVATHHNFTYATPGQKVATIKSMPFAVPRDRMEATLGLLRERGPVLQARPIRNPSVAILYSDPLNGERARQLFEPIVHQRLARFGTSPSFVLSAVEEEEQIARALQHLLRVRPTAILVASTTAPAGPEDIVGRALTDVGCHLERFLAPVEPGNLMMLSYKDDIPILSAPGCYRSVKPNAVDLVLPPVLAQYKVSCWEVSALGHGGLLS